MGFGRRPALLVVDMTRGFTEDEFPLGSRAMAEPVIRHLKGLLDTARRRGVPVFYSAGKVWHTRALGGRWLDKTSGNAVSPELHRRSHEINPELEPQPGDVVINKIKPSAFFGTELAALLNYHGVDTTIVTGLVTSGCVLATVVDAFSYNYRVIVPEECVGDRSRTVHEVTLYCMDQFYADVVPTATVQAYLEGKGPDAGADRREMHHVR